MYTLYASRFSRSLMVEMVLAEGGIAYEKSEFDFRAGENRSAAYLAVNPLGWIPALRTPDGTVLYETPAINLWLCETHGIDLVPAPTDPARGRFLSAFFNVTGEVEPVMKRIFYPDRCHPDPAEAETVRTMAWGALHERLAPVEAQVAAAGPFLVGDRFTLADLTLAYWLCYVEERSDMSPYPALRGVVAGARARPRLSGPFDLLLDWIRFRR